MEALPSPDNKNILTQDELALVASFWLDRGSVVDIEDGTVSEETKAIIRRFCGDKRSNKFVLAMHNSYSERSQACIEETGVLAGIAREPEWYPGLNLRWTTIEKGATVAKSLLSWLNDEEMCEGPRLYNFFLAPLPEKVIEAVHRRYPFIEDFTSGEMRMRTREEAIQLAASNPWLPLPKGVSIKRIRDAIDKHDPRIFGREFGIGLLVYPGDVKCLPLKYRVALF